MNVEIDGVFKIVLIGDSCVGKTGLLERFYDDKFDFISAATIGLYFKLSVIDVDGKTIRLQTWDTPGAERLRVINRYCYRQAHGFIVVYDITRREAFHNINSWFEELDRYASNGASKILVGTKCDLEEKRVIEYAEGKALADSLGISFFETSVKDSTNVEKVFMQLTSQIMSRIIFDQKKSKSNTVNNSVRPFSGWWRTRQKEKK